MKANFSKKVCGRSLSIVALALAGVSYTLGPASIASCQEMSSAARVAPSFQRPSGCPAPIRLPVIPLREPRPGEGTGPDQQWQIRREPDVAPMASFVETLQGNDAVVEVVLGQGRLLTLKADIASQRGRAVIAVADPSVVEFEILPNPRLLRLMGHRAGITDLSITTADNQTYSFEVHVVYDINLLSMQLRQAFPDTQLRITQMREHLAVEGEVRSIRQVDPILETVKAYLKSVQPPASSVSGAAGPGASPGPGAGTSPGPNDRRGQDSGRSTAVESAPDAASDPPGNAPSPDARGQSVAAPQSGAGSSTTTVVSGPQVLNLLRVPGVHQVMLQVRIAELNRTAAREIGMDVFGVNPATGGMLGSKMAGAGEVSATSTLGPGGIVASGKGATGLTTSAFGIFPNANFELLIHALRKNSLLTVLAEPNLVAMSGQHASFVAGGELRVPKNTVSQGVVSYDSRLEPFGVSLDFLAYVLEDERVRLTVSPEVSALDYALGTIQNGEVIPGRTMRKTTTTVEMRQGQTLAIAGLLQVETDATTERLPGLGDIPYLGTFFSSNTHKRIEKELLVLVTPYLVAPMDPDQVPPLPGAELKDPNDLEFYLLHRLEGRTGREFNATHSADDPLDLVRQLRLEQKRVCGPVGFSSSE